MANNKPKRYTAGFLNFICPGLGYFFSGNPQLAIVTLVVSYFYLYGVFSPPIVASYIVSPVYPLLLSVTLLIPLLTSIHVFFKPKSHRESPKRFYETWWGCFLIWLSVGILWQLGPEFPIGTLRFDVTPYKSTFSPGDRAVFVRPESIVKPWVPEANDLWSYRLNGALYVARVSHVGNSGSGTLIYFYRSDGETSVPVLEEALEGRLEVLFYSSKENKWEWTPIGRGASLIQ